MSELLKWIGVGAGLLVAAVVGLLAALALVVGLVVVGTSLVRRRRG